MGAPLLSIEDLCVSIYLDEGVIRAVNGVSFTVEPGQTMALVGESGSGKTMVAHAILRILPRRARIDGGRILFAPAGEAPRDLAALDPESREMRAIRGGAIGMVFQEPMTALSPVHTIGEQIAEVVRLHRGAGRAAARAAAIGALEDVGFPDPARKVDAYPFELSGGLRQRAMIAMALVGRPSLLIADEPTSALDVTVQAQILDLLLRLQREHGMGLVLITHDPGVVAHVADVVTVMYCGRVMESGPVATLFTEPQHPYLQALLRSTPRLGHGEGERLQAIPGSVPDPLAPIRGCPFLSRCPEGEPELCGHAMPPLEVLGPDHRAACYKRGPGAAGPPTAAATEAAR
ncbi:MAG TPA: ABC transporter ATP-binding protein [Methylomirabilota bacterium]|jgi:oligopeptide/dipeptide ABC transporter ATP-binding protein|nr:ABC transporter ATP-binding protein [Methylomirabilota bacterium]